MNRLVKLISGVGLIVIGLAIVVGAIKFSRGDNATVYQGMNPCSETMLIFGAIVGLYGVYLIYAVWNPEAAAKLAEPKSKPPTPPPSNP